MKSLYACLTLALTCALPVPAQDIPVGYVLAYEQDFLRADTLKDFVFSDAKAWRHAPGDPPALELFQQSQYRPPHRSPVNIALLDNLVVGDCIVECEALQTGREYGHRDMIFVVGYQNPSKYYYVHIATAADPNANNVFLVNDAPRRNIATETNRGNNWGLEEWHKIRIERKATDGSIAVFFDDMKKPIMKARDTSFGPGHVGFGSFDDTGKITRIRVWARTQEKKAAIPFSKPK